jgi:hypothetical protein
MLHGGPGIGKSSVVAQIIDRWKANGKTAHMVDVRLSQMDPTDLRGIPFLDNTGKTNKMAWAPPVSMPSEEMAKEFDLVVLFLDEINGATPSVQAAAYQLILDRAVGEYKLPDNVAVIAAGNRASDQGVTFKMPAPLRNRFIHYELRHDFDAWYEWASDNDINADVLGYLISSKISLYNFSSKTKDAAFATPRSWAVLAHLLDNATGIPSSDLNNMATGIIGAAQAIPFMAFRKNSKNLPNPTDIMTGKVTKLNTQEISALYSLTISLVYELKTYNSAIATDSTKNKETLDKYMNTIIEFLMDNFETEMAVMGMRLIVRKSLTAKNNLPNVNRSLSGWKRFISSETGKLMMEL